MSPARIRGATLLDALVAASLLVVAVWLAARWQQEARREHRAAANLATARTLLHTQLETLRVQTQTLPTPGGGEDRPDALPATPFHRRWWIEPDATPGLSTLRVRVEWPGTGQTPQGLEQRSLLFVPGHWHPADAPSGTMPAHGTTP